MIELRAQSVRDFMRGILPTEPHFPSATWYFRGQADAKWGLIPSLRRVNSWRAFGGTDARRLEVDGTRVIGPDVSLRSFEHELSTVLRQVIRRMGLPVSLEDSPAIEAFAQHIGLPTRLLDWTESPWTAAYFAAAEAAAGGDDSRELAVYAVSKLYVQQSLSASHVEEVEVSSAGNPNSVAQHGRLLKFGWEVIDLLDGVEVVPIAHGFSPSSTHGAELDNHLVRVTLSWRHAADLLRTLRNHGMHGATIYPGQAGVARLVTEVLLAGVQVATR